METEKKKIANRLTKKRTHTHTHLEHLEDFEEAGVWEEGAAADSDAVPTPERHSEDQTDFIFWRI